MPYLTNEERETIVCFNEQESTARVFTYNRKMSNYLREQASDPQTKCRLLEDNLNGGLTFEVGEGSPSETDFGGAESCHGCPCS